MANVVKAADLLQEISKNTRGINSRKITYKAIGRWVEKEVERESRPEYDEKGNPKLDDKGNQIRTPLGKDKDGKLITITETVRDFESDGVLTDISQAMELVNFDEQLLLDCFAEGWNEREYAKEAGKDELDEFIKDMELNEDQTTVFKRTARQLSRGGEIEILEAAEMVKALFLKKKNKAA
jgi:hypothetical protein